MLTVFPFLPLLAAVVAGVLLAVRWSQGDSGPVTLAVLVVWFGLAGYCQFFTASALVSAAGLALQTGLAVFLLIWWRVTG
jgi:hypothetical protein